ncbi:MAG: exonuclease domain-containing protein [Oscillospiraceae bacterium]
MRKAMPKKHNKIVLDLEFNPIREPSARQTARHEIIEIGAVMLNDSLEQISSFQEYIKPELNIVEEKITQLTGITNEKVADCGSFNVVMHHFMEWIGDTPCTFYTWSDSDRNVMLDEADLKCPDDPDYDMFYVHWVDLQMIYQRKMGLHKSMGLANALGTMQIYFAGTEHGALADAINTAEVMRVISDRKRMEELKHSSVTFNGKPSESGFHMNNIIIKKK